MSSDPITAQVEALLREIINDEMQRFLPTALRDDTDYDQGWTEACQQIMLRITEARPAVEQALREARSSPVSLRPISEALEEMKRIVGDDRYHALFRNGLASARQKILSAICHDPDERQLQLVAMPLVNADDTVKQARGQERESRTVQALATIVECPDCHNAVCPTCGGLAPMIYEDQLPSDISRIDYDRWFAASRVIDGVRMGPPLPAPPTKETDDER